MKQRSDTLTDKKKANGKFDLYNILISLECLEINYPVKKADKPFFVTMVVKRGDQ